MRWQKPQPPKVKKGGRAPTDLSGGPFGGRRISMFDQSITLRFSIHGQSGRYVKGEWRIDG